MVSFVNLNLPHHLYLSFEDDLGALWRPALCPPHHVFCVLYFADVIFRASFSTFSDTNGPKVTLAPITACVTGRQAG